MQRHPRARQAPVASRQTAWVTGYAVGATIVAVVVALVSAILAYARSIANEAPKINAALKAAERNTAPLAALQTTIDDASAITSGLQRGRARLGG
jgi:alpha/beta superfamily hydrolase